MPVFPPERRVPSVDFIQEPDLDVVLIDGTAVLIVQLHPLCDALTR